MLTSPILCVQRSGAIKQAAAYLSQLGLLITHKPAPDVSHVLLPVPSFQTGDSYLAHLLAELPNDVVISGGNLDTPLLQSYCTVDFLKDPYYLAENAAITASCALKILKERSSCPLRGRRILVVGWGRIGKCLCQLLNAHGAEVTVATRKDADRAMIRALGCRSISIEDAALESGRFDAILNTVPAMVLPDITAKPDAIVLELASKPGISGTTIVDARGLPGKMAPEKSGQLIAKTFLRLSLRKEQ